jgi:hypothetical protein
MADLGSDMLDGTVIRLAVRSDETDFTANGLVADAGDFSLNTKERQRVTDRDGVGSISVWDSYLATAEQADAFLEPKKRISFRLNVALIRALPFDLHVIREPLDDSRPGGGGHCGLQDVWRSNKAMRRQIQGRLALLAGTGTLLSRN